LRTIHPFVFLIGIIAASGRRERVILLCSVKISIIISGCFVSFSNATREATVKSTIAISFVAALALLIAIPSGADAVGVGKACDGFVVPPHHCNRGLFCQRATGQCFFPDIGGTCAAVPRFCPHIIRPVCGCDGKTYGNDCKRLQARVSKSHDGMCL
jgi:Kazal-type serine protease inhibitor domain